MSVLPTYGSNIINLSEGIYKVNDSLQIEVLKFYISGIKLFRRGDLIFEEKNSYHLIDASEDASFNRLICNGQFFLFDKIQFNLGIDSLTNVSGALGGDLDPTKGMYWAWHSGYINFKLEGKINSNKSVQYHLGGYQFPNNALKTITLNVPHTNVLVIKFDIKDLIDSIDFNRQSAIMSPSREAVLFSDKLANSFKLLAE